MSEAAITRAGDSLPVKSATCTPVHHAEKGQRQITEKMRIVAAMRIKIELQGRTKEAAAKEVQREGLASRNTALRTWERFQEGGQDALARKPRADRDTSEWFDAHRSLKKVAIAAYTESDGNSSYVRDVLARYLSNDDALPCNNTIQRFIEKNVPKPILAANRLPKQKWNALYAPYLVTGRGEFTAANHVWSSDHRQLDILVADDRLWADRPLAAIRPWQTLIQDMRTRVIVASLVTAQPDSMVLATAMRAGVSQFGKPGLFYCDNGKDFKKLAETLARIGVDVQYCTPRHPQAKFPESTFSFVSKRFDRIFYGHGYTGWKPEVRSEFCREQEKQHAEFLAGKRRESPLYPLSFVTPLLQQWVKEYNEEHEHSGRGMNGRTPLAVMNELLPLAQRKIPDMAALEPLFWKVEIRKVSRCKVQIGTFTYSAALNDPESQQAMYEAGGAEVAVHCDPNDMAYALAFENRESGRLLARLVCDELAAQRPHTHEEIKAMMHQRAKLYKTSKEAMRAFTAGVPTGIELLAQRAGIKPENPASLRPHRLAEAAGVPESAEDFVERLRLRKAQ